MSEEQFNNTLSEAVKFAQSEVTNLGSRNSIRWNKGITANKAIELAKGLPKGTFTGSPQKFVRERMLEELRKNGHTQAADVLSANELSITTGAARAWLDVRGAETTFGDDNELVVNIAIDKAYALRSIKRYEEASTALLTFASTHDEAACKNLRKLAKLTNAAGENVSELINEVQEAAAASGASVNDVLKARINEIEPEPEFATIKVDAALHDGDWTELRAHMGLIDQFMGFAVEETSGLTTNTRALERVISWFVPREYGFASILNLMVENGEMTQAQAEAFTRSRSEIEDDVAKHPDGWDPNGNESSDELLEALEEENAELNLPEPDTRLLEDIKAEEEAEKFIRESTMSDDFDFDDDPVYEDDAEPLPWD